MAIHSPLDEPPEQIFLDHLPRIEKAARHACQGVHLQSQEVDDFVSSVRLKFMDNEYEVIRKFRGQAKIGSYLVTCVGNLFKDYLNRIWGKWRPSAEAKRLGGAAIHLERLLVRDGYSLHQACEILLTNHRVPITREQLEDLAAQLPPRSLRRIEGEEALEQMPAPGDQPEEILLEREREEKHRQDLEALARARARLPSEDRLILRLRNDEGLQIAAIARRLGLDQKGLYRRIERIYKTLRELLENDPDGEP